MTARYFGPDDAPDWEHGKPDQIFEEDLHDAVEMPDAVQAEFVGGMWDGAIKRLSRHIDEIGVTEKREDGTWRIDRYRKRADQPGGEVVLFDLVKEQNT